MTGVRAHGKPVLERALALAGRGWPVFPCQPGGKAPATRRGHLDATTDPDQITRWFTSEPGSNLAVATGAPGPDVLDVDQHGQAGSGYPALRRLAAAGLTRGASAAVATPGGGMHLYFSGTDQRSARLPGHHIDFRSAGGYVIVPPSAVGGRRYRLLREREATGALDWAAVTGLLEPARQASAGVSRGPLLAGPGGATRASSDPGRLAAWVAHLEPGNRNSGLFWAANRVLEADPGADLAPLAAAARQAGLPDREIRATLRSARQTTLRSSRDFTPSLYQAEPGS